MSDTTKEALAVGTRIYNSGDMANNAAFGTVTAYHERGQYSPEAVDVEYETPRFEGDTMTSKMIPVCLFASGPVRRFMTAAEYNEERAEKLAALQTSICGR